MKIHGIYLKVFQVMKKIKELQVIILKKEDLQDSILSTHLKASHMIIEELLCE